MKRSPLRRKKYSPRLDSAARQSGYASYEAYLASPTWEIFRKKALSAWNLEGCLICGRAATLHHISYQRVCHEHPSDVVPLCVEHHEKVHRYHASTGTGVESIAEALVSILGCSKQEAENALKLPEGL